MHNSRLLPSLVLLPLLILSSACDNSPQAQLKAMGLPITESGYIEAIKSSNPAAVSLYLSSGINPDSRDQDGVPALSHVIQQADQSMLTALIQHGADLELPVANDGMTALMLAAMHGQVQIVQTLLAAGVDMDHRDEFGNTALIQAAASGHAEIVVRLLNAGADANRNTKKGLTPLMASIMNGHADLSNILIQEGVRLDARDFDHGMSALAMAASFAQTVVVTELLVSGAEADSIDNLGLNPLAHAVSTGNLDTVRAFISQGVHPDLTGPKRQTALSWAVLKGDLDIARYLLEQGANPNFGDSTGLLPVQIAQQGGDTHMIELLVQAGGSDQPDVAITDFVLLASHPKSLPHDWLIADPFTDKSRYFQSFTSLSTAFQPPLTRRALLRSDTQGQSQILFIFGRASDWQGRFEQRLSDLTSYGRTIDAGDINTADRISINYVTVLQPEGLIAGSAITQLLGIGQCNDMLLMVNAGGASDSFDQQLMLQLVHELNVKTDRACSN